MDQNPSQPIAFKVLTVNVHKGFTTFNRRFILHELRDAVRTVEPDLVFLQEVLGTHHRHASRFANFPQVPHYEFLADTIWHQHAYGRNAVYDNGDHGNALLSKFPITHYENHDISISGPERRGMLHCVLQPPGHHLPVHAICVHLGLQESHRQKQLQRVAALVRSLPVNEPVVLAGDFNDWRQRAHGVLQRDAGMQEVFVELRNRNLEHRPIARVIAAHAEEGGVPTLPPRRCGGKRRSKGQRAKPSDRQRRRAGHRDFR